MNKISFQNKKYENWKDYFFEKFSDRNHFIIEHLIKAILYWRIIV